MDEAEADEVSMEWDDYNRNLYSDQILEPEDPFVIAEDEHNQTILEMKEELLEAIT